MKKPIDNSAGNVAVAKKRKVVNIEKTEDAEVPPTAERVELDERTTQILEDELQAVMIKVWQTLPDNPPSAAERSVAERLRNEASDDIRNVLGLNVAKRLLNVYNPLFLRVSFSCTPDTASLKEFIKIYNIKEFRQHQQHRNLYIARVHNIADFDRLCITKNDRCGNAIVTVKPSYLFSQCPANLSTVFQKKIKTAKNSKESENSADIQKEITDKKISESEKIVVKQSTKKPETEQESVKSKIDQVQMANVAKNNESDKKKVAAQNEINANLAKKLENQNNVTTNKVSKSNVVKKENDNTQSNITNAKPNEVTTTVKKVTTPVKNPKPHQEVVSTNKATEATLNSTIKPTTTNIKQKPNQVNEEVIATKKVTESTPKSNENLTATTNTKVKPNQGNQQVVATKKATESTPKSTQKLTAAKPTSNQGNHIVVETKKLDQVRKDTTTNVTKPKPKQVNQKVLGTKKVNVTPKLYVKNVDLINSEHFDETDEMDDEEILALISNGVIVDECSGSDDE